jgi:glycosyltransferase involved in cell wall biosynthesis
MKLVSVIIPVFGVEKYIEEAIQSVLNQTYQALEIIVVNDGTTDSSMELVRKFKDERFKIIEQENQGLASARNLGISLAKGDYLALLDPDDCWLPNKIEIQVSHMEVSPQVGLNYGVSQMIDEEGNPTGFYQRYKSFEIGPKDLLLANPVGNGSSPLIRRDAMRDLLALDKTGGGQIFDSTFRRCEDLDCWLRLSLLTNWKLEGLPQCLVKYRLRSSGLSGDYFAQYASFEKLITKLSTYAPEFANQYQSQARARQLRFGSCAALRAFQPNAAKQFILRAIREDPLILLNLPLRVLYVFIRIYSQKLLTQRQYVQIELVVARIMSSFDKQGIADPYKLS